MKLSSEADIDELIWGSQLVAVIAAWNELGLWGVLAASEQPTELAELARDLPGGIRGVQLTVPMLAHAGLLEGAGNTWQLTPIAREMYEQRRFPNAWHLANLEDLGRMSATIQRGGPAHDAQGNSRVTRGGVMPENIEATRGFLDGLHRRSGPSVERVTSWVMPRLRARAPESAQRGHLIDIGGGHGRYGHAFAQRGLEVTIFDQPVVIDLARQRYGDGLHHYRAGDFHDHYDFGGPYDAALLSNIVHSETYEQNADLIRRLYAALVPGGLLVLKDMFIDEQGRDPARAVFFGTIMLSYTRGGRSYSFADVCAWTREAGFQAPEYVNMGDYTLAMARKPDATTPA